MTSGSSRAARRAYSGEEAEDWARALARDLIAPPETTGAVELAMAWRVERVRVVSQLPSDFADYPELSVRVRGAFGRALAAIPPSAAGGWSRPAPFTVLFASAGRCASGLEVPKPVVVRAWTERRALIAEVSLFGASGVYLDAAREALAACLDRGIALGPESRIRVALPVTEIHVMRIDGLDPLQRVRTASLIFRTPVAVRSAGALSPDPAAILRSLLLRVSGMARWQGLRLEADWAGLHRAIEAVTFSDAELLPVRWRRYSLRRGDSPIPMAGWLGPLRLAGRLDQLAPFLAMAETCNTGSHASLGLGWFDLSMA